jgi:hypothetical protein
MDGMYGLPLVVMSLGLHSQWANRLSECPLKYNPHKVMANLLTSLKPMGEQKGK